MFDTSKLKPGDEVAWRRRYNEGPWHATTVNRVLSTQIVTEDGMRWTRKNGFEVGGGTSKAVLREVTPEIKQAASDAAELEALSSRFNYKANWKELDLATLRRVKAALDGEAPRRAWAPDPTDPLVPMLGNKPASTANDCQLEHSLWAVRLVDSGEPNGVNPKDLEGYRAQVAIGTKRTCRECLTVLEPDLPVEERAERWRDRVDEPQVDGEGVPS